MTGADVLMLVLKKSLEHGPEVVRATKAIVQSLQGEHEELRTDPLPAVESEYEAAKRRAAARLGLPHEDSE